MDFGCVYFVGCWWLLNPKSQNSKIQVAATNLLVSHTFRSVQIVWHAPYCMMLIYRISHTKKSTHTFICVVARLAMRVTVCSSSSFQMAFLLKFNHNLCEENFFFRENKIPFLIRIYSSTLFNWLNWNSLLCSNTLTTYKICIYAFLHGVAWQPPQLTVHQNVRDGRTYSYDRMCAWHDCVCVWVSVLALGMCSHSIAILVFLSTGRVVSFSLCFYAVRMRVVFTLRKPAVDFYRFILFTCFSKANAMYV